MANLFAALLGIYMTGCTLIFTVWGFQRLVGKRRPNLRIQALEDRISQLEVAVAKARRDLQPQAAQMVESTQDCDHTWTSIENGVGRVLSRVCDRCNRTETGVPFQWPTN